MARPKAIINPKCGNNLKALCEDTGTTQAALAELVGLTPQTISKIINNHCNLTRETAEKIVKCFPDYLIEWLLGLSDVKTHSQQKARQSKELEAAYSKNCKALNDRNSILYSALARCGYEVEIVYSSPTEDSYRLKKGDKEALVSGDDLYNIVDEMLLIAGFQFNKLLESSHTRYDDFLEQAEKEG